MTDKQKDRLEWLKHVLGDPDVGRFYSYAACVMMKEELEHLEALAKLREHREGRHE